MLFFIERERRESEGGGGEGERETDRQTDSERRGRWGLMVVSLPTNIQRVSQRRIC